MNCISKLAIFTSVICLELISIFSCISNGNSEVDATSRKIDSLIEIQKINEQCIFLKFGFESVTAINTQKGIVLIDAGISSGLTAKYRKIIENEFQTNVFTYIINTHGHPDHVGGNSIFPESGIIGHLNCIQEISEQWKNPEKRTMRLNKIVEEYELELQAYKPDTKEWNEVFTQKARYLNAYNDSKNLISVKQPDITFSDSLTINMGDITFEMFYFGKCHSSSDIVIFVPEMKILCIGDLFITYGRPSINDTLMVDKDRWQKAVHWLEKRMINIEKVIGGHGQILSIDDLKSFNSKILGECSKK